MLFCIKDWLLEQGRCRKRHAYRGTEGSACSVPLQCVLAGHGCTRKRERRASWPPQKGHARRATSQHDPGRFCFFPPGPQRSLEVLQQIRFPRRHFSLSHLGTTRDTHGPSLTLRGSTANSLPRHFHEPLEPPPQQTTTHLPACLLACLLSPPSAEVKDSKSRPHDREETPADQL